MIRSFPPRRDHRRARWFARRQWHARLVVLGILNVEGVGRTLVVLQRLETRWSDNRHRQLWRVPAAADAGEPAA